MCRSNVGSTQILDLAGDPENAPEMKSRVMSAMVSFRGKESHPVLLISLGWVGISTGVVCYFQSFH